MARYEITAPDGSRYEITAPDDASEQDVMSYAQQQFAQAPRQRPDPIERPAAIEPPGSTPQRAPQRQAPSRLEQDILRGAPRIEATPSPVLKDASLDPNGGIQGSVGVRRFVPPGVSMGAAQPTPQMTLDARMQGRVAKEREQGGIGLAIDDTVRTFTRGSPVGSWLDEANAGIDAGLNRISGGAMGMPYAERMAYEKARNEAIDKSATPLFTTPLGTVDTADALKLAGALASFRGMPKATLMRGTTIVPRTVNTTATGAMHGGIYGAGEGQGLERLGNAAIGTGIGAGFGFVAPLAGKAISGTYSSISRALNRPQGATAGMEKSAVKGIAQSVTDDNLTPAAYQKQRAALGPEGMLADMGDNLRMDAGRIARNPGEGRSIILGADAMRKETSAPRIRADVDVALGRHVNVPEVSEQLRKSANMKARPFYEAFEQETIRRTAPLENILKRAEAGGLMTGARKKLLMDGLDPDEPKNLPLLLNALKVSADDAAEEAFDKGLRGEGTAYAKIARAIRTQIEWQTRPKTGGPSNYRQALKFAAPGQAIPKAIKAGQEAFDRGYSPDQMAFDMKRLNQSQQTAYRYGARDYVRQVMGDARNQWGANDDTAARTLFNSQNAREKLDMIANPGGADRLIRRVDAETEFAKTREMVRGNSITSTMNGAAKKWPSIDDAANRAQGYRNSSLSGLMLEKAYKIADKISGGYLSERNLRIQADAARMLVAQGAERDAVAAALMQFAQQNNLTGQRKAAIENIARHVLQSPRQLAIEKAPKD